MNAARKELLLIIESLDRLSMHFIMLHKVCILRSLNIYWWVPVGIELSIILFEFSFL
jgi:hypothetical protein